MPHRKIWLPMGPPLMVGRHAAHPRCVRRPGARARSVLHVGLVVGLVVGLGACGSARDLAARSSSVADPSAGEALEPSVVPLPGTVGVVRFPRYASDGTSILLSGSHEGSTRGEVLSVHEDGSDLRCLTCGVAVARSESLLKPIPFTDGRRVMVQIGEQSPLGSADHAVIECAPSVDDCGTATVVPIEVGPGPGGTDAQGQRELRVSPDGEHVGFTVPLASGDGDVGLLAVVARLERTAAAYEVRDARVVSTRGEVEQFTPDGASVIVAGTVETGYDAANPDVFRIDLASGSETRITHHPDYDESLEYSPDGSWYVVGSGRGSGTFETVAQLRRPNVLGSRLSLKLYRDFRDVLAEPWLVRDGAEASGGRGQQLNPGSAAEGFHGRAPASWKPDGTAVVFAEGRGDSGSGAGAGVDGETRILVVRLRDRSPDARAAAPGAPSPAPGWAAPLDGFGPVAEPKARSRDGASGGRMDVAERPDPDDPRRTTIEVTYSGFADESGWVIDGAERVSFSTLGGADVAYEADLVLSGAHEGHLRADVVTTDRGIDGHVESEVDGHHLELP